MRKRLHGHVLGTTLLVSLLAAAAMSCVRGADAPEDRSADHAEASSAELTRAASQTDSAATLLLGVEPGARIDRPQLVQLLGDRVPAAAGESCTNLGQMCATRSLTPTTSCGGFSSTCDSSGTQSGVFVDFICLNINGNATCTGVVQDPTVVTVACSRVTNGLSCGAQTCDAPFCLSYDSTCAQQTTQVQNCVSAGVCSNDVCTGQVATQQVVGTCQRNTNGTSCGARTCDAPFCLEYANACAEQTTQVQNCVSAGVCSSGGCTGQVTTQQAVGSCQRNTDFTSCPLTSCSGRFTGECRDAACRCVCRTC